MKQTRLRLNEERIQQLKDLHPGQGLTDIINDLITRELTGAYNETTTNNQ